MESIYVGPSEHHEAWRKALVDADEELVVRLAREDAPGAALFELATFVNGKYKAMEAIALLGTVGPQKLSLEEARRRAFPVVRASLEWASEVAAEVRRRLGWEQRAVDVGLMRWIRWSSCLSAVIGAGATMAVGGPSWSELVRRLLLRALEKGHEVAEMVTTSGEPPLRLEGDKLLVGTIGSWESERRVIRVDRFEPEAEAEARRILALIDREGAATDTEELMRGAQLCSELFGQELFTHLTGIIYSRAREPSPIHRAIAELAHAQAVPGRGDNLPGWDAIVTYNFDDLMGEALDSEGIPRAVWAMSAGQMHGDPSPLARELEWHQAVYHVHGYTPRRLFLITHSEFVFSTMQYLDVYGRDQHDVLDVVFEQHLARPLMHALYVGCSFQDAEMNRLLRRAAERYPGRNHFALLKWPEQLDGEAPDADDVAARSATYLEIGVQPIWIEDYDEIPAIISGLR